MAVITNELPQLVFLHIKYLRNSEGAVFIKGLLLQFFQKLPDAVNLFHHFGTAHQAVGTVRGIIRERGVLFDINDSVNPKAGNPFFQPPVHHVEKFFF